jgi:prepilin-type N-terminal cleavage/methylation domain-containing protein/prepilin-type processing-associated H-X9-DG protein
MFTFPKLNLPKPISRRPRLVALTLIELLVVIAIIAVLAALLIPALSTMRNSAKNTTCVSNLRQIGSAINLYASEHDGLLPAVGFYGVNPYYNRDPRQLQMSLLTYLNLPTPTTWSTSDTNAMSHAKVFTCPGWKGTPNGKCYTLNNPVTLPDGTQIKPWGFMMTATGTLSPPPMKAARLIEAGLSQTWAMRDADFSAATPNHKGHRNALFFDTHVGRLDFSNNPL